MKSLARGWRCRVLIALLLAGLFPLSAVDSGSAAAADDWVNVTSNLANMQSACGNLMLLSAVPRSKMLIAGVAQQGLWASSDAGASWQRLGTGQGSAPITNGPSWISYDPLNPARFYESGIYGSGVFATSNGGTTFAQLGSVRHSDFLSVDYTDPARKTLLAGGHEQSQVVWKSTDGGKSWTNIGLNLPSGTGYSTHPLVLDAHTYLVNGIDSGIFRTTDGGTSWTKVASFGPSGPPLVASDGSIYWEVGDGLAKSSDHGVTWSVVGADFRNGLYPIQVPGGLLVTSMGNTLVASSDGGATWAPFGPALPYGPGGIVYSEGQKALFIWHWDCGNQVLPDAVQKLNFDFAALAAAGPIAHPPTAKFLAHWVSPSYVTAGEPVTVHQDAFADQDMNLTLSVDILNSRGELVLHSSLDNQVVAGQRLTPLAVTIPLPTSFQSGTYVVKTAAFGPDGTQYAQSDSAGKFVAVAAPPTPTPVPGDDTVDQPDQPTPDQPALTPSDRQ